MGVRFKIINRVCVNRRFERKKIEINDDLYEISYKISFIESDKGIEIVNIKPEFDDLKKISELTGLAVRKIQLIALVKMKEFYNNFTKPFKNNK